MRDDENNPCRSCVHFDRAAELLGERAPHTKVQTCSETPLDRLRRLLPGVVRSIEPGQTIALEGEANGQVIGVISGLVRCFRLTADGRRHICRFGGAGSLIGLGPLGVQRHSAEAITAAQVIVFRAAAVEAAIERDPQVRAAIMRALADELTEREHIQLRLGRLTADQRVADFLLELADREGPAISNHDIPMSRADIADHLGVTIETVSRALHRFNRMGLIALKDSHHFLILAINRLRDFIEGDDEPIYIQKTDVNAPA